MGWVIARLTGALWRRGGGLGCAALLLGCGGNASVEPPIGTYGTVDLGGGSNGGTGGSSNVPGSQGGHLGSADCRPGADCFCDATIDYSVCVDARTWICSASSRWQAIDDGPCRFSPPNVAGSGNGDLGTAGNASVAEAGAGGATGVPQFSPDACQAAGGWPLPAMAGVQTPETDCESGVALGVIDTASSGWEGGGLCCAAGKDPAGKACGGRAGDTCSATEYCAYLPGQLCGAADAQAQCQPRPRNCLLIYVPVCGCDGWNYDNACAANRAGSGLAKAGTCPQ